MCEKKECGCCMEGYYESFSAAVADINDEVMRVDAGAGDGDRVRVRRNCDGQITVTLLEDVSEDAAIEIRKDVVLELAGKRICFSGEGCLNFGTGTDCQIDGTVEGSGIARSIGGEESTFYIVQTAGARLRVLGGSYEVSGHHASGLRGIQATAECGCLELEGCAITAVNGEDETGAATKTLQTQAVRTVVKDCTVVSEGALLSQGMLGAGDVTIEGSEFRASSREGTARAVQMASGRVSFLGGVISADAVAGPAQTVYSKGDGVYMEAAQVSADCDSGFAIAVYGGEGAVEIVESTVRAVTGSGEAQTVYGAGGTVVIRGGSVEAETESGRAYSVYNMAGTMEIAGAAIDARTEMSLCAAVYGLGGTLDIQGADVYAITWAESSGYAYGISVCEGGILRVRDTSVFTDARKDNVHEGVLSIAITNDGTAFLEDLRVHGTHSGVLNGGGGKLYVSGGTYTGNSHGGFYFAHGPQGEAFVNDATLRGGYYEGVFDGVGLSDSKISAVYIGGGSGENSSNMVAYLDGCVIDGSDANTSIVVRGSSDEQNNTLNVSNCTLVDTGKWIRVDNDTLRINIGMGTNITEQCLKNREDADGDGEDEYLDYVAAGRAVFTGGLYRRHHEDHVCDGKDYEALKAFVEAKLAQ
ncbi:MAG: hypothetical protein IJW45_03105 [Oscillospiraceae bacterium]|nr:hypothetical protein [Oscillospiraceae bacterium]